MLATKIYCGVGAVVGAVGEDVPPKLEPLLEPKLLPELPLEPKLLPGLELLPKLEEELLPPGPDPLDELPNRLDFAFSCSIRGS
jgi:hypothetical protein